MAITLDTHLSLYSIPVVFAVGLAPHVQKILLIQQNGLKISNVRPRDIDEAAEKKGLPVAIVQKIRRLNAAHTNSQENFPVFLSALFAGYIAGLDAKTLNIFSLGYIGLRIAYNIVYANQTTEGVAALRSLFFWVGTGWSFYIVSKAAFVLSNKTS